MTAPNPADCWPSASFDDLKADFPDPPRLAGITDRVLGLHSRPLFRVAFGHQTSCERRRRGRPWATTIALILSSFSRVDLQNQFAQARNAAALERVGQWFRSGTG